MAVVRIDPVTAVETQVPSWVHGGWYTWVYVIKDADRGKDIQARVSFLDDHGNTETLRARSTEYRPHPTMWPPVALSSRAQRRWGSHFP